MVGQRSFWKGVQVLGESYLITGARDFPVPLGQKIAGKIFFFFSIGGGGIAILSLLGFGAVLFLETLIGYGDDERLELICWAGVLIALLALLVCRLLAMFGMMIGGEAEARRPHDLVFLSLKFFWSYFRVILFLAFGVGGASLASQQEFSLVQPEVLLLSVSLGFFVALPMLASSLLEE